MVLEIHIRVNGYGPLDDDSKSWRLHDYMEKRVVLTKNRIHLELVGSTVFQVTASDDFFHKLRHEFWVF